MNKPAKNPMHPFRVGQWFVFDTDSYDDGDLVYGEVLAIVPRIADGVDRVGEGSSGYRVRLHCAADVDQKTPVGVEDYYTYAYVDEDFTRLTKRQVARARAAGWPSPRRFMRELRALR